MTAPVLDNAVAPAIPTLAEGATNPGGMTVEALVVDGSITDVDGVVEAIAIEGVDTSLGTWQYSLNGGTEWLTIRADLINSGTNTLALLLGPTDMVRLLPFGDLNGIVAGAITFRAWDMSSSSAGNYGVTTPGVGAFSAESDTASITVTAVNDAPTFAQGTGKAIIPVGSGSDVGYGVTVQPDGKIIVAGQSYNGSTYDFSLVRLNTDGSLDSTFGNSSPAPDGKALIPVGSSHDYGQSVTVQPDGKIIVAGYSFNGSTYDFSLVRLNTDGSLDSTFGNSSPAPNGKAIIPVGSSTDHGYSTTLQPDGKIIVAGHSANGSSNDFSLMRLNANGNLDSTFDLDGKAIIPVGSSHDFGQSVTVQPDGKFIVAGYSHNGSNYDFSLVRLNANGSLDTPFGNSSPAPNGKAIIPVGGGNDQGQSVTVQPDGKIIVAGYSHNGSNYDFSLVRLNANGSLDTTFGNSSPAQDGKAIIPVGSGNDNGFSVTVQPDGKIIVAGYSSNGTDDFSLVRLNADGSLDTTFGGSPAPGKAIIPVGSSSDVGYSVTVQPDGKIIVAGYSSNGTDDFSLVRLNADGSLDLSFNGLAVDTLGGTVDYTEGAAAIALANSVAIHDVELAALNGGAGNYAGASISLARNGGANSEDVFSALGNLSFAAGDAILSGVTVGSVSNTGGTLTITFDSDATQARVNEVLSSLGYANSSLAPPASVTIDWSFSDGNVSAQGTGGALTAAGSTTVNITPPPNEAPVLATAVDPVLASVAENATSPTGTTVAALVVDGSITDADGSPVEAIAITALDTSLGTWQYSLNGTDWLTVHVDLANSTTNELALLLGPTASVRLLPFGELNGTLSEAITFRAWDQSTGSEGNYVVIAANGGTTAFSTASDTASITVTAVNDAPTFAPVQGPGKAIIPVGSSTDIGYSVTVQPDGKIIVRGWSMNGSDADYSLVRLNADGSLDTTFGGSPAPGKAIIPVGSSTDFGYSVTVQPDGKIIVAGYSFNGSDDDFSLVRLNADGSLDTTFGGSPAPGKAIIPVGSSNDVGYSVTVQPDGKIIVAGRSSNGSNEDFSLVRLNADGSLDSTFGGSPAPGKAIIPVGSSNDLGYSVTVQPDGKIIVAGFSYNGSNNDFSLVRLNADGSLDTTFGNSPTLDGKAIIPVGSDGEGQSVTVQPDGKIIVAGYSFNGSNDDFRLVRLNADGTLDTSFGNSPSPDGKAIIPVGGSYDQGQSVTVQPDGKIIVAGYSWNGSHYDFSLLRLNADGTLDSTFGGSPAPGKAIIPVGSSNDYGYSVTVQPDGKIIVAGRSFNGSNDDFSLVRLHADGSLDLSFNGAPVNTLGGTVAYTQGDAAIALDGSVAIQDVDLAALASGAGNYAGASVSLARSGGASSQDVFSALGNLSFAAGDAILSGVTIGSVTNAAGTLTITFDSDATQARVNEVLSSIGYANSSSSPPASVTVDWSFSDGNAGAQGAGGALTAAGSTTVNITAVPNFAPVLATAADPVLASVLENATSPTGTTVAALVVDGSITDADGSPVEAIAITALDTSLGTWQYSLNGTDWLTVHVDLVNSTTNELALLLGPTASVRLLPFGELNGTLSEAITFRAWEQSTGSEGNYVVIAANGGSTAFSSASDTASITVTAVNDAPTFAPVLGTGKAIIPVGGGNDYGYSTTVQPDGKIIVAGRTLNGGTYDFSLVRLNADGSLDNGFDLDGKTVIPLGSGLDQGQSVTVQSDGKIIVAGYSFNGSTEDFSLVRLNADGSLDTTFGNSSPARDGKAVIPVGSSNDIGYSVTVQPDGKIIVAGRSFNGTDDDVTLVRLNADGSLDTPFGNSIPAPDGKAIIPVGSGNDQGQSVTVQPDGKIIVAGYSFNGSDNDFSLVRLNADGSLDTAFGNSSPQDGKAIIPVGSGNDQGQSVTVQPDGKVLVAGLSFNGSNYDFSLVRLNADGGLDSTFGGSPAPGQAIIPVGSGDDLGYSVTLQPDGKIIMAGYSHNGSNYDFSLMRLNADGSPDSTFGGSPTPGKAIIAVGSATDLGYSVTLQPDGKIVVAGASVNGGNYDFSLVRLNADGSLDLSFNGPAVNTLGGTVAYTEGTAAIALDNSVAIQDVELAALASGAGNYAAASISLARSGGANSQDVFSALGNLSFVAGDAILSGVTVGSVTNTGGTLTITFDSDATQARVNEVLSSLGYANSSDAPPASLVIDYIFSDGNTGVQGLGGALTASGSVTVNITTGNDTPTLNQALADQGASEDSYFSFQFAAGSFADPDGDTLSYSATLAGGGALPAWLAFNGTTRTFSGTPGNGDVGTLSVTVTASDGNASASDTFDIVVANTNDAPTGGVTIAGAAGLGHTLTAVTTTLADADGLGPLHYTWLRNGVAIAGAADSVTYKAGLADFGSTLSVRVSYTDLGGTAESVISAPTALIALAGPPPGMNPVNGGGLLNILKGTGAGDWFSGGLGIDWMTGSTGDDIYFVNSFLDFVVESPGGGTDTAISSALAWILPANVENLLLNGPFALIGTGNALNNIIVGNAAANTLYGLDGADMLKGLGGADWLEGGNGDDVLVGGLGRDTLTGGAGRDVMVFDVAPGTANADTIRGFSARDDTIELVRGAGFQALDEGTLAASAFVLGRNAGDRDDRIMYDRASGNLYYDADGTGAIGAVQIATLIGSPELTNLDIVVV